MPLLGGIASGTNCLPGEHQRGEGMDAAADPVIAGVLAHGCVGLGSEQGQQSVGEVVGIEIWPGGVQQQGELSSDSTSRLDGDSGVASDTRTAPEQLMVYS